MLILCVFFTWPADGDGCSGSLSGNVTDVDWPLLLFPLYRGRRPQLLEEILYYELNVLLKIISIKTCFLKGTVTKGRSGEVPWRATIRAVCVCEL